MQLVARCHFWSRDKDGGHTIQSAIAENPMLHANFMAVCFIELALLLIEILHCGNRDFQPFCSCDLDLDLHIRTWPLFLGGISDVQIWTSYLKVFESYRLADRQTRLKLYTTPLLWWSVSQLHLEVLRRLCNIWQTLFPRWAVSCMKDDKYKLCFAACLSLHVVVTILPG